MEHGCRNFHYRSSLAKSCKLRELTLKFHRENYERKEGGEEPRLSSIEGGKRKKKEKEEERRKGREKGRKGKEDRKACGRERDSTEARNEVESIGWRPSFSRSLHRLGIGADQLRTIRIAFGIYYQMVFQS